MPESNHPHDSEPTPPDALGAARSLLITASRLGNVALARRDDRGAHEIFACAARTIIKGKLAHEDVIEQLEQAVDLADVEPEPHVRAEILGHAITELLGEVIEDAADNEGDPFVRVQQLLASAISLGAQAYNLGLHRACYEVYAAAARMAAARWPDPSGAHERIREAQEQASLTNDESRKAWLLREAFDVILAMAPSNKRNTISSQEVRLLISMAIQIGAPAYNLGDRRGCYEIYAATARLLTRVSSADEMHGELLRKVLQKAVLEPDVTEQAWMLRRAFDAILATADETHD